MVHPCGSGAFGYFECTHDVSGLTKANFLSSVGEKTPVFVRFSTVTFGREFPDEGRNPRGFAIKFYTMEGNYDIVGLNFVSPLVSSNRLSFPFVFDIYSHCLARLLLP
jgi:catalase